MSTLLYWGCSATSPQRLCVVGVVVTDQSVQKELEHQVNASVSMMYSCVARVAAGAVMVTKLVSIQGFAIVYIKDVVAVATTGSRLYGLSIL